ncbi:MAG: ATP--guanido phosphotransferase [Clostridia bacterium]|nr:ATP--guanido phosphotransferase [Clostridia bacterium]
MADYVLAPDQDVVVSSRVRLARNFADIPFVHKQDELHAETCIRRVASAVLEGKDGGAYALYRMNEMDDASRMELCEHRLISNELAKSVEHGAALISSGRNVSVMINEDDHIRIQAIMPGVQLDRSAALAFSVDDAIGAKYQLAFDSQLGYLTSFPTDVGTGMRASVILHLPALTAARQTGPVMQAVSKLGLTLRGFYGEGSDARGNIYVLTNQASLGRSEDDILKSVAAAVEQIVGHERQMREKAEKNDMIALQDKLMRSFGELMYARVMNAKEMYRRLSDIRYAASMGYAHAPITAIDELMQDLQPGSLRMKAGNGVTERELDVLRADILRKRLTELQRID